MKPSDIAILIVDDEASIRNSLAQWFELDGYRVGTAEDASNALVQLQKDSWDIVMLDIKMPGMDGLELQRRIRKMDEHIITIMMTAFASVDTSIQALKEGAFDYVVKPVDPDDMGHLIRNAVEKRRLFYENRQLRQHIEGISLADEIIGESPGIKKVIDKIIEVAQTDAAVLIRGEHGVGKELVAKAIHSNSMRRYAPMIAVNCAAPSEAYLETELFGHEKGAFPGALYSRQGRFEMADNGTLFFDEVGGITEKVQADILGVMERKKLVRLGGDREIAADFRVVSSTTQDLERLVHNGAFRKDLYYKLNVVTITIPPLRERRLDIPSIARFFIKTYSRSMNKAVLDISNDSLDMLVDYHWPGNVRELRNVIERAMVVAKGNLIELEDLSFFFPVSEGEAAEPVLSLEEMEKRHIQKVLNLTHGNIAQAAGLLKVSRLTMYNKIKKYQLKK
ncbi:sigma-54 dependent transcriptional regulator [Desulfobotulus sp.]|jgi:DNA-binding NtrC family response regulator|uniref:sigma-54-dependent transcriptional regulator n=1 Tax=Desulfobotulus sp. TaxID=1940337 RepID=UPI002A36CAE5|nr:sigma-54 dependent transcriptional regulator [Desulfobotulus sp.]MDY0164503.1 sigma-54 dependent transcriptional regulator [Desulfobotulus sp.]